MSKFKEYKGLSLSQTHKDVLENWRQSDVFNQSIESRKGNPTFTFYEGPPSANGISSEAFQGCLPQVNIRQQQIQYSLFSFAMDSCKSLE